MLNAPGRQWTVHPRCKKSYGLDGVSSSVVYKGVVKKLLYAFKYKPFLADLKNIISDIAYEGFLHNESLYYVAQYNPLVTCVPLYAKKLKLRGYNHAALLAYMFAQKFELEFLDKILIRAKDTKPQFKLSKENRLGNIKDAFIINRSLKQFIAGKKIFLVDDVATTFSTLSECAKVLKQNGASFVWGVTFAREM